MNSESVKTFVLLCDLKSFSQTAQKLFISQSAVSARVKELEAEMGCKLLFRDKHSVTLTKEGKVFLDYAKRMSDMEDAAKNAVAGNSFRLRVGATNSLYESVVKDKILKNLSSGATYSVTLGHSEELIEKLGDGLLDVAYIYVPYTKSGFVCEECLEDELVLVCRADINGFPDGIRMDELRDIPCAVCNFALRDIGSYLAEIYPPNYVFPLDIDNSSKVKDFLDAGLGYSFLPREMVAAELKSGRYAEVRPLDFSSLKIRGYRSYREDVRNLLP